MGNPAPSLNHLRQSLARLDPTLGPRLADERVLGLGVPAIDEALSGGMAHGTLHEFAPAASIHLAAANGFAVALAGRAAGQRGQTLWIATDFAMGEGGGPYGPGLDLFGLASRQLLMLRVPRAVDALWAMEEALRCRALNSVIAELGDDSGLDLTATRRLVLAAREGGGIGCLLRHRSSSEPSAAATRWVVSAAPSRPDRYGGLGLAAFDLALIKNRRGPSGRWTITWDHHEHRFQPAVFLGVAEAAVDRPDRTPSLHTG